MTAIRLKRWAEEHDLSYRGALRLFHAGEIPGAYKIASGTILVEVEPERSSDGITRAAIYARVSTRKQAESLGNQAQRITDYCAGRGYQVVVSKQEIASGLNENRRELEFILNNREWDVLVVEHRDRLARFGARWIEGWVQATGRRVEYMNAIEGDDESLADDLISVIASFSGRLYGKRGATARARKAVQALDD